MDGRKNNKGTKNNKGGKNYGFGKSVLIKENVDKFSPIFWKKLNTFIKSKDKNLQRFAITEFNKIQVKMIPTDVTSGGEPLQIGWLEK